MSPPVDREMIALYLLQELDDRRTAELVKYVAEDPAWAAALREEAEFDVLVGEALDALPPVSVGASEPAGAEVASGWAGWWRTLRVPVFVAASAFAVLVAVRVPVGEPGPLPDYSMVARVGGEALVRGSEPAAEGLPVFTVGSALELQLVPATAYTEAIEVEVRVDGAPVALAPKVSEKGVVDLYAVFGEELPVLAPGQHRIEVRLAPKGGSSEDAERFEQEFVWRDSVD